MWIARTVYDGMIGEAARQAATIAWMQAQINALQIERAALVEQVLGVRVQVPILGPNSRDPLTATADHPESFWSSLSALSEDMGDEAAAKLKIRHDDGGTLIYD